MNTKKLIRNIITVFTVILFISSIAIAVKTKNEISRLKTELSDKSRTEIIKSVSKQNKEDRKLKYILAQAFSDNKDINNSTILRDSNNIVTYTYKDSIKCNVYIIDVNQYNKEKCTYNTIMNLCNKELDTDAKSYYIITATEDNTILLSIFKAENLLAKYFNTYIYSENEEKKFFIDIEKRDFCKEVKLK